MVSVRLKMIDDGMASDLDLLTEQLSAHLKADKFQIDDQADLTMKIKFMLDNDQEVILLQLRESKTKVKLGEKVLHFIEAHWMEDIVNEAHALLAATVSETA